MTPSPHPDGVSVSGEEGREALANTIEKVLFDRALQGRLDGYTRQTSYEVADAILGVEPSIPPAPTMAPTGAGSGPHSGWRSDVALAAPRDGTPVDLLLDDGEIIEGAVWGEPTDQAVLDESDSGDEGWLIDGQWASGEDQRVVCWRPLPPPPAAGQDLSEVSGDGAS